MTNMHYCRSYYVTMMVVLVIAPGTASAGVQDAPKEAPPSSLADRAGAALAAGRLEEAELLLEEHLRQSPGDTDSRVRLGWCVYRLGAFDRAARVFSQVLSEAPSHLDARVGLAYAKLQGEGPARAAPLFEETLARDPRNRDALRGLLLCGLRARPGSPIARGSLAAGRRLLELDPSDRETALGVVGLEAATGGPGELRPRRPENPSKPLRVPARAGPDYLEVEDGGAYRPTFVKGVNLGAALPGRHPTEFPEDEAVYAAWLEEIAWLGANAVRVYTLHPPVFYHALADHNRKPGSRKLLLLQGVWAELPPRHDFSDSGYVGRLEAEIARIVDAVHGNLVLAEHPGRASGSYDADVSPYLLGFILGREWEPFAVKDYDALRPDETTWQGKWFRVEGARAMECWVARIMDFAAGYEASRYRVLVPIAFANWPTLDPLRHPTESTRAEEDAWRKRYGIPYPDRLAEAAWEDDAVSLDATRVRATAGNPAGTFASYHIYPNYPDFLNLDPAYAAGRDGEGPSRYAAYLEALEAYHGRQPVLVAEFGISTSRGIAHVQPEGWHHGGHDEHRQGEILARMFRAIRDRGMAGGIVFELLDEWFKATWSAAPLEIPGERRRLWFNAESPEQSYGLLAARPARASIRVDGDPSDWTGLPPLTSASISGPGWASLRAIRATSDEGYLYLLLSTGGGPDGPDWRRISYRVALDTYAPDRGERRLPPPAAADLPTGVEFLAELRGPGESFLLVSAPYEPCRASPPGAVASPRAPSGRFVHLVFETNRERFGRDGTRYPAHTGDRGALRYGSLDPASPLFDSTTDVAVGTSTGTLEIRLPWGLLGVADPSSRRVLHDPEGPPPAGEAGTVETKGFGIYAFAVDPSRPGRGPLSRLPAEGSHPAPYLWPGWEQPRYFVERKRGLAVLAQAMAGIPDRVGGPAGAAGDRGVSRGR